MTIFERLRSRPALLVMLLSAVALVATACLPANPPPEPGPAFPPFGGLVETNPGLFPHFSTGITDYVSRCNLNQAVLFSVNAPPDTTVSVDGQPPDTGQFNTFTFRDYNQSFTIVVQTPQATTTHYVRCLPPDFPDWSVQRPGTPQAGFYLTSPTGTPVIFDNNGVPMWWWTGPNPNQAFSTFFDNGHVTFGIGGPGPNTGLVANVRFEEHALDGSLARSFNTVGADSDGHDAILLPNGNYAMVTSEERCCFNMQAAWNNPNLETNATILDHVIQEVTPQGNVVWSWRTSDHIPPSETADHWRSQLIAINGVLGFYDIYHWNSIEWTGSGFLVSYRHDDAVYKIHQDKNNAANNDIVWKLGGSDHSDCVGQVCVPKSLAFGNDPFGNFGGQHDARVLPDGTVTVHDNGTGQGRAPRAVRYTIDTSLPLPLGKAGTATFDEQAQDTNLAPSSFCCGSARKLSVPNGNWVMGWGGTAQVPGQVADQVIEETQGNGTLVLAIQIHGLSNPLYRGIPILEGTGAGQLTRQQLRAGMDAEVSGQSAGAQSVKPQTANGKVGPEFSMP